MSWIAVGMAGAALIGGAIASNSASNSAETQAGAEGKANQLQYNEFEQQQANLQPYQQAGQGALSQLAAGAGQAQFNASDFQEDPGYQFDLAQGQQAIQRSAAASGQLMSGGTLKALNNYSQNQASNEYQNAYNRFTQNQTNQFNRLSSIAGIGQTANAQVGQAGTNMANQVGSNITGLGNAVGASQIAQGNAATNALSGITNAGSNWQQQQYMNQYLSNLPYNGSYSMPQMGSQYGGEGPSLSNLGNTSGNYWSQNPYATPASE